MNKKELVAKLSKFGIPIFDDKVKKSDIKSVLANLADFSIPKEGCKDEEEPNDLELESDIELEEKIEMTPDDDPMRVFEDEFEDKQTLIDAIKENLGKIAQRRSRPGR